MGSHNQNDAMDYCKKHCFTYMKECRGFFFQKHTNGHEICGFYTSDAKCSDRINDGHMWRSVCLPTPCHTDHPGISNMFQFTQVYGKGSLAMSKDDEMKSYMWKCTEDNSNAKSPVFFVKRVCDSCPSSHKEIVYKRLTPVPEGMDLESLFLTTWSSKGNILNTDFELYNSMPDALKGHKADRWTFCNYDDPGIGFPRDCGPHGYVAYTWGSLSRGGQKDFAFYLYNGNPGLDTCTAPTK